MAVPDGVEAAAGESVRQVANAVSADAVVVMSAR